jgi:5-methylcytosine-specific restriction endonuclease McrBC regulatory subunit McrC
MPLHSFVAKKLRKQQVLRGKARLRLDYVLKMGDSTVVYDAKYKERLQLRDLVSLLA